VLVLGGTPPTNHLSFKAPGMAPVGDTSWRRHMKQLICYRATEPTPSATAAGLNEAFARIAEDGGEVFQVIHTGGRDFVVLFTKDVQP
jgi:hypothetical protein